MDNLDDDVLEILENIVEDSIKPRKRKNWRGFTLEDFKDYYQEHHQGKKRSQVRKEDSSFYDAVNRRKLNDEIFPSFNRWSKMSIEELKQYYMDNFDGKNRKEVKDDVENNGTAFHSGVRDRGLLDEVFPPTVVKPPRFWQNKTVEELIAYREEHFPGMSRKEIRNDKNNGGRAFISAVDRGGLRDKVLPPLEVKPSDYWRNFENIKLTIQPMIDELGRFPFKDEMAARNTSITASIQKYHGGVNAVRNAMGYSPHQRPVKYWMDPKNVKKELDVIIAEFGEFPTMPQILKKNPNLNQGIKDHHGIVEVRSWYGEKPLQKPRHYWKNFDHVEAEIREIETRLGHFPTSTELRGSGVMNGIQKYHGGLKTVKVKLGYANDELEVLREVIEDM